MSTTYVAYCTDKGEIECSGNIYDTKVNSCNTCNSSCDVSCQLLSSFTLQKKIQKQTGVSSSTYMNNLVPFEVTKGQKNYKDQGLTPQGASQASDRNTSVTPPSSQIVHRNTNSLRGSRTSLKPGSLAPGNNGVDIKHNSYDRYLAKLKVKSLKPISKISFDPTNPYPPKSSNLPMYGNKRNNISIFNYGGYKQDICNEKCNN